MASHQTGDDRPCDLIERGKELVDLCGRRIGDKYYIFVVKREFLRERIGFAIPEIKAIHHRRQPRCRASGDWLVERTNDRIRFIAEQKDTLRLGKIVTQSLRLCERVAKRNIARAEGDFRVPPGGSKYAEGLRHPNQGEHIA